MTRFLCSAVLEIFVLLIVYVIKYIILFAKSLHLNLNLILTQFWILTKTSKTCVLIHSACDSLMGWNVSNALHYYYLRQIFLFQNVLHRGGLTGELFCVDLLQMWKNNLWTRTVFFVFSFHFPTFEHFWTIL